MGNVHKGPDGLSIQQRRILMELASGKTLSQVCVEEDIPRRLFNRWMQSDEFSAAFDDLFSPKDLENLKKTLELSAVSAIEVYEDAIAEAVKKIKVEHECSCGCGTKDTIWVTVADWKSKLHAADTLLKISNILVERRSDKLEITHNIQLTTTQMAELMGWRSGIALPPDKEAWYRENGFIKEGEQPRLRGPSIEAEFRELT